MGAQGSLGLGLLLLRGVLLVLSIVLLVTGHVFVYDCVKLVGESCARSAAGGGGHAHCLITPYLLLYRWTLLLLQ
jgi:hypothetical protein